MAIKKALALYSGRIKQLQAGDSLEAVETGQTSLVATSTTTKAMVGYIDGAGSFDLAKADATGTSDVVVMAVKDISAAASGQVQTNGFIEFTTGEWDAVCGTTGGLTPGTTYFLSADTAGHLTATAPTTVGHSVVAVIIAVSTTIAKICIERPILL